MYISVCVCVLVCLRTYKVCAIYHVDESRN